MKKKQVNINVNELEKSWDIDERDNSLIMTFEIRLSDNGIVNVGKRQVHGDIATNMTRVMLIMARGLGELIRLHNQRK